VEQRAPTSGALLKMVRWRWLVMNLTTP